MGRIDIVLDHDVYYRRYAVELNDNVSMICYRYGLLD